MSYTVVCDDVLDWAAGYAGEKFHAVLCDPSYGLGKHPDIEALLTAWLSGGDYDTGPGFMCKDWDTLPGPRHWAAIRRHCYPGAYLFAFGGTRTADLLSIAIRLGGWEKFDEIDYLSWTYGSGFPKSHNISKAVDQAAGMEREVIGLAADFALDGAKRKTDGSHVKPTNQVPNGDRWSQPITAPATPMAATWNGYGTALKPAHEPVLCFRNPLQGTYAENCVATGAGSLWIDGGRVATGGDEPNIRKRKSIEGKANPQVCYSQYYGTGNGWNGSAGRWPANVLLQHLPGCQRRGTRRVKPGNGSGRCSGTDNSKGTIFDIGSHSMTYADPDGLETVDDFLCQPGCPVAALAAQSGELGISKGGYRGKGQHGHDGWGMMDDPTKTPTGFNDRGTAARFFYQATWEYELAERLAGVEPFYYCAKSSRGEREAGLDGQEYTKRIYGQGIVSADHPNTAPGGGDRKARNHHPCCKPLSLTRYLARLLLPPPAYAPRRCLIPFLGSGSEAIGAGLAGFEEVVGVEMEADYVAIAEARLRHWLDKVQLELSL